MVKDYYKILGLTKKATEKEIKEAYRKLAKQYHPDTNPHPEAHEMFIDLKEAHDILSDADTRYLYNIRLTAYQNEQAAPLAPTSYQMARRKRASRYQRGHYQTRNYTRRKRYSHSSRQSEAARRQQALKRGAQIGFAYLAAFGKVVSALGFLLAAALLLDYMLASPQPPELVLSKSVQHSKFGQAGGVNYQTPHYHFQLPQSYGKYLYPGDGVELKATPVGKFVTKVFLHSPKVGRIAVPPIDGLYRSSLFLIIILLLASGAAFRKHMSNEIVSYLGLVNSLLMFFVIRAMLAA
ncbi:MAG: J domain-containing protein [Bacteroidetes bacterium]|nr:MAG: J domain-containing protein [Bacteroidota bacterium]